MRKFEIYTLILCVIVFVMLVSVFSYLLAIIIKQWLKQIRGGLEDEEIIKEFSTDNTKKQGKFAKAFNTCVNVVFCLVFGGFFLSSIYINCTQNVYFDNVPTYRVVLTSSMETKNKNNKYLFENDLDDQLSTFDLIKTYKLPKEEDLELYDIVVYEVDGILVVHRIVGIEEPNEKHPDERHFLMQGDAVGSPDRFPVLYSQMRGIYKGEKIPFVGSFVLFMQSPAGWLCILLVVTSMIGTPIMEKKLYNARKARYLLLMGQPLPALNGSGENSPTPMTEPNLAPTVEEPVITPEPEPTIAPTQTAEEELAVADADIYANWKKTRQTKTFMERLALSSEKTQGWYHEIVEMISRIEKARVIEGKTQRSYKSKTHCLARMVFRGKTLHVCIGLDPKEYENTKYIYVDVSDIKRFENYPMRVKISSDRQARWTKELLMEKARKAGLSLMEDPETEIPVEEIDQFAYRNKKRKRKTFRQKLNLSPIAKARYKDLKGYLLENQKVRVIEGKYQITYKIGNRPIVRFAVRGKTLNAYVGLSPVEYENTKYIFTDVSDKAKNKNYPMRVKVSSDRQVRWTKELISQILEKGGKRK